MNYAFQVDSSDVRSVYEKNDNYLVELNLSSEDLLERSCAIYFSSHGIYYPNTSAVFERKIVLQDYYEWKKNKIKNIEKHIFLRDVFKQWYIKGINSRLPDIESVLSFLQEECKDSKTIITVGSSAGGYAAVLFGSLLKADKIYCFNGQLSLERQLLKAEELENPILLRERERLLHSSYLNLEAVIRESKVDIFYFNSANSKIDQLHLSIAKLHPNVHTFIFKTNVHRIPFYLFNLSSVLNSRKERLLECSSKIPMSKFEFSVQLEGYWKTVWLMFLRVLGLLKSVPQAINQRFFRVSLKENCGLRSKIS